MKLNFFFILETKISLSTPFLSSLPFLKFWEENFMNFERKHIEAGPNCSHGIPHFLKYYMPLKQMEIL